MTRVKGTRYIWYFLLFCSRKAPFGPWYWLHCTSNLFWKLVYFKITEFVPFSVYPISAGRKYCWPNYLSLNVYPFPIVFPSVYCIWPIYSDNPLSQAHFTTYWYVYNHWMGGKTCRPWSDVPFSDFWSGTTLFAQAYFSECLSIYGCTAVPICVWKRENKDMIGLY